MTPQPRHEIARWPRTEGEVRVVEASRIGPETVLVADAVGAAEEKARGGHVPLRLRDARLERFLLDPPSATDAEHDMADVAREVEVLLRPRSLAPSELADFAGRFGRVGAHFVPIAWAKGVPAGEAGLAEPLGDLLFEISALQLARGLAAALASKAPRPLLGSYLEAADPGAWRLRGTVLRGATVPGDAIGVDPVVLSTAPTGFAPRRPAPELLGVSETGLLRGFELAHAPSAAEAAETLLLSLIGAYVEAGSRYAWVRHGEGKPDLVRVFDSPLACAWRALALGIGRNQAPRACVRCGGVFMQHLHAKGPPAQVCSGKCQKAMWRRRRDENQRATKKRRAKKKRS